MGQRRHVAVLDALAAHPVVDHVLPAGLTLAFAAWGQGLTPTSEELRIGFAAGASTLAALVLAAATFVCAMTYQSSGRHMQLVRRRYASVLKRNWTAIIGASLLAAVLPLVALLLDEVARAAAMGLTVYALGLTVVRFFRCLYWLRLTLFFERVSESNPEPLMVKLPEARRAS